MKTQSIEQSEAPPQLPARGTPLAGVIERRKATMLARLVTLIVTIVPFLGIIAASRLAWGGISGLDLGLLAGFYTISILGVTIGFHRMLTHGGFETPAWLKVTLAIMGSLAVEGSVISWVADHRRHHMFTDREGDPHSPHLAEEEGIRGIVAGLWHAHMGWFFDQETTVVPRFAPDLL